MAWVVDTCLLLDVGLDDPGFGAKSEALLLKRSADEPWNGKDTEHAARARARYILERRAGSPRSPKRPVADVMIGSFASRFEGLLTRNVADFRKLYPKLRVASPS